MTETAIAEALRQVRAKLAHRPEGAAHPDTPAIARWEGGLRVTSQHANGTHVATDMPRPLGGAGTEVTPGWLLRAALASCLATRIAMEAATREIDLTRLEVVATSESDARGMFGMSDAHGQPISPGPRAVQLHVRIAAPQVDGQLLRTLVEDCSRCSPVQSAVEQSVPVSLRLEIQDV